jgi:hypothetical protein
LKIDKGGSDIIFSGTSTIYLSRTDWSGGGTVNWAGTHTAYTYFQGGLIDGTQNVLTGATLTIDPQVSNSWGYSFQQGVVDGTLVVNNSVEMMGASNLDITINGTVAGSQTLNLRGNSNCDLVLGANALITVSKFKFSSYRLTITGDFHATGNVEVNQWTGSSDTITFAGDSRFQVDGNFTFAVTSSTYDWNTTNKSVTHVFGGNVTMTAAKWNPGDLTILNPTAGANVNFNGKTVDGLHVDPDSVGPILLLGDVTASWFRDCAGLVDVNGFTLTYDNVDRCAIPYNPPAPPTLALKSGESINTGLVAWWALTDGSGSSPADISGNSETLTNGGSSEWGVQSVGNVAVTNNSTGAYYSTDSAFSTMIGGSTPATDPWTISFWVSTYLLGATYSERGILSIGGSSADGTPFLDVQHSGTTFRFFWAGPGGWTNITGVSHREWANVTISFDGTTCSVYTDGTLGGSRTATGTNGSTSDKLWIGTGYDNTSTVPDTYIQNVRIWSTALTAQQVSDIYTTPWLGSNYEEVVAGNTYFFPAHFGGRL